MRSKGFTLVEMAIVLVIIGIILAGVMKGRDIVRGSQVKQFSQQFAQKWATIAQSYYDKTGQLLLDGNANGGPGSFPVDGVMKGWLANSFNAGMTQTQSVLRAVGITPCTLIKSKLENFVVMYNYSNRTLCEGLTNPVQTLVEGEYTGSTIVTVDLRTHSVNMGGQNFQRNFVILFNVPADVAQGVDTLIDGKVDGTSGSCLAMGAGYAIDANPPTGYSYISSAAAVETVTVQNWEDATSLNVQTVGIMLDY